MKDFETARFIARRRMLSQQIVASRCVTPAEIVAALGAVQAQDYTNALWAIGLRIPGCTEAEVEEAIRQRTIVRTWPMRGTLHFVPAADVRWMQDLLTPRVLAAMTLRAKALNIDEGILARARKTFERILAGGKQLTRDEMLAALEQAKISTTEQRGFHILSRLGHEGLICFAARSGKQASFALMEEWSPGAKRMGREESLAELARRYFTGHGPATVRDFIWWSGLKSGDAKAGIDGAGTQLIQEVLDGATYWTGAKPAPEPKDWPAVHLLPAFDEYLLGYEDRSAVLAADHAKLVVPGGNGMFLRIIVTDGKVSGTWKQTIKKEAVIILPSFFQGNKKNEIKELTLAAKRYSHFLGKKEEVSSQLSA